MTPAQRDAERGREIQARLLSAAKAYAADTGSLVRFDELVAAGVAFGARSDAEWAARVSEAMDEAWNECVDEALACCAEGMTCQCRGNVRWLRKPRAVKP